MTATVLDLRCPTGPRALLMKLRLDGDKPRMTDGNLMELACRDCARNARQIDPTVRRVLHRFAFDGSLVESVIER